MTNARDYVGRQTERNHTTYIHASEDGRAAGGERTYFLRGVVVLRREKTCLLRDSLALGTIDLPA